MSQVCLSLAGVTMSVVWVHSNVSIFILKDTFTFLSPSPSVV